MNMYFRNSIKFSFIIFSLLLFVSLILFLFSCNLFEENIELEPKIYTYSPEASLDLYIRGNRYLNQGKYKEAENSFEKLVIIDPEFSKAWEGYSESLLLQNDLDQSLEYIDKAISLNSSIASHLSKKSLVLYYLGDYDASETFSSRALEIDQNDVRALIVLGAVKTQKGLYDQSKEIFDLAIKIEPDDSSIYFWRGKNYINMFDFDNGMIELNKAIDMDRSQPAYYIERGQLYRIIGNKTDAKFDFEEAIEIAKNPRKQHLIDKAKALLIELEDE